MTNGGVSPLHKLPNMKNRIDDLIKLGMKNPAAFDKATDNLAKQAKKSKKLKSDLEKEFKESLYKKGRQINELAIKVQLQSVSDMINMSYIAKNYFGKSRQWLSHRVNGATVNGKPAQFTKSQIETLNIALKDIGKKIGSISVHH